jgi:hypothetical protein
MGLILPLVVYTSAKTETSKDPHTSYNIAKRNFLIRARTKIAGFYDYLAAHKMGIPKVFTLGYDGEDVLFEDDLRNRPKLRALSRECTIILAEPGDVLRRFQDGCSPDEFEMVTEAISGTSVFFVPDFQFPRRKNQLDKFVPEVADAGRYFMSKIFENEEYRNFSPEKLASVESELVDYTLDSFFHIKEKIKGMQKVVLP